MSVRIIFAGLLGLAVMLPLALPLALPAMALASPQDDLEKGRAAHEAKDYPEAVRWYRKAAEQGNASAQFNLGLMYAEGKGVAQDDREAVRWFRKAAEQGHAEAQNNLGNSYRTGLGVARDYREALRWYHKAAEQGHIDAQYNLGAMYWLGIGVMQVMRPHNNVRAHKWFNIASALGGKFKTDLLQLVEKKMNAQQIAEAQREAKKWLEAYEKRRK